MTLSLVAPTAPVTRLSSGIIVVRCADYVAGATTVSDATSVSGTVVSETQTAPVQTTFASQGTLYGGRADTISVPNADLLLDADALNYRVFIAMKVLGEVPSNAKGGTTWESISRSGASAGFGWGKNTGFVDGPLAIARSRFEEYLIYGCGDLFGFSFTSFKVRGWGITGGTVEMRFDLIYLVPFVLGPFFNDTQENSGIFGLPLQFDSNGTLRKDSDDNASTWIGAHSVSGYDFPWMREGATDVQEDDDEPTAFVDAFGDWTDEAIPRSFLAYIAGGTKPPDAETILTDTFGYPDSIGRVDTSQFWTINGYLGGWSAGGGSIDNSYLDGFGDIWRGWVIRSGLPSCYFGANETATVPLYQGESRIDWGRDDNSASADPRDYLETLKPLREGVVEGAFRFDTIQEAYGMVGFDSDAGNAVRVGGVIQLDASGNVKVSVRLIDVVGGLEEIMDEATVLAGVGTGDIVRVKAERRVFTWRAKAWIDGDTEPDWQVEGVEPIVARSTGGTHALVSYPWDTNWAASANNDVVLYDPRQALSGAPAFFPIARAAVGPGIAQMIIDCFEFIASFDPGSGTPGDMQTKTVKYDGTVLDPTITVPYGSHRFVAGTRRQRRFNLDTDAYSIWAWKSEGGEPDTQFASVGYIWELRDRRFVTRGPIWKTKIRLVARL